MPYNKIIDKISNAEFQMIPAFYRKTNPPKKTLAICIDRFETPENKQENILLLTQVLENEPTIEMILCDLDATIQLFEHLVLFVIERCSPKIDENKLMIVNYINFISPNHTEYYLEQNLAEAINRILCNTRFRDCFYQWFGYHPNLYNFIYTYNAQYISYGLSFLCDILQKSIGNENLTIYNKHKVKQSIQCKSKQQLYDMFLQNVRDICHTESFL